MRPQQSPYLVGLVMLRVGCVLAQTTATEDYPTTLSGCHFDGTEYFCFDDDGEEYEVVVPATATTTALPDHYDDCHSHEGELFCVDENGEDWEIHTGEEEGHEDHDDHDEEAESEESEGEVCHVHAGVEHCTGGSAAAEEVSCERTDREYNVPLRVGFLFIILVTSSLGVFGPIFLHKALPAKLHIIFTILKQFGTGIIISTAFVHLFTHANLMFENECLAPMIEYESTPAAILMAGLLLSFIVEYAGQRYVRSQAKKEHNSINLHRKTEMVNIMVLEAGIIFHSLLIGLTLVVAGDGFFKTLFIVILFHQMFEGIALGSRIAALGHNNQSLPMAHGHGHHASVHHTTSEANVEGDKSVPSSDDRQSGHSSTEDTASNSASTVPMKKKLGLAAAFALITPLGMAIGIGVLDQFNGNDPSTLIAIGTLDALSAGILVWVGVVEMWAEDWMLGGELTDSGPLVTTLAFLGLISGFVLMSLLGKWA